MHWLPSSRCISFGKRCAKQKAKPLRKCRKQNGNQHRQNTMNTGTLQRHRQQFPPRQNSGRNETRGSNATTTIQPLIRRKAWKSLAAHSKEIKKLHLRKLFAQDGGRGERFAVEAAGLFLDYSKNRITDQTVELLLQLAAESGLRGKIDALFGGDKINVTENRAVLHVALRAPKSATILVDGKNVVPDVHAVLDKMADFSNRARGGEWKGFTGKRIRNIINIGIGGSDLGPVMAYEALRHYTERGLVFRFVSNVDGIDLIE